MLEKSKFCIFVHVSCIVTAGYMCNISNLHLTYNSSSYFHKVFKISIIIHLYITLVRTEISKEVIIINICRVSKNLCSTILVLDQLKIMQWSMQKLSISNNLSHYSLFWRLIFQNRTLISLLITCLLIF